jgi:hypothetical protein
MASPRTALPPYVQFIDGFFSRAFLCLHDLEHGVGERLVAVCASNTDRVRKKLGLTSCLCQELASGLSMIV